MATTPISQPHWDLIVERIREGRCVPFLGAGVNASSDEYGYTGLPVGGEVALSLLARLTKMSAADLRELADVEVEERLAGFRDLARPSLGNLARVALHYVTSKDSDGLMKELTTILADEHCEPSPLLQKLAELPFGLIVTTNYDGLMERALTAAGKPFTTIVQPIQGFVNARERRRVQTELSRDDVLVLYKIHGSFPADGAPGGQVLITEEDYIEYLTVVGVKDVGVPSLIAAQIVDSTLLFLGYSLEDWDFRTIFKGVVGKLPRRDQRRSFAIQRNPSDFWVTLWRKENVEIYDVDLHGFAAELEAQYAEYCATLDE